MKVKSIIYMVLALSLCCGCSDWLTVDSKTILSEEDIAKYPELAEAQFLSNYAELRKSIHSIGDGAMSYTLYNCSHLYVYFKPFINAFVLASPINSFNSSKLASRILFTLL